MSMRKHYELSCVLVFALCCRHSVPFTVDDISAFGDDSRELFIKSSCYSTIPITMSNPGPAVAWTFTSEPKSIAFSVVYRESPETPLEQAKVRPWYLYKRNMQHTFSQKQLLMFHFASSSKLVKSLFHWAD